MRFDNNGLHSVILEGFCDHCKYVPYKDLSMFYYFKASVKNADKCILIDCPICNSKKGLRFEILS